MKSVWLFFFSNDDRRKMIFRYFNLVFTSVSGGAGYKAPKTTATDNELADSTIF